MPHPSRQLRGLVMTLQVMTAVTVALAILPATAGLFISLTKAYEALVSVRSVTAWRTVWVCSELAAVIAMGLLGCGVLWSFWQVLEEVQLGRVRTARNAGLLGDMARGCAVIAAIMAAMLCFYAALESMGPQSYIISAWEEAIVMMVFPLTFFTAALLIRGVRALIAQGSGGPRPMDDPRVVFTLLRAICAICMPVVMAASADAARRVRMPITWGSGRMLSIAIDMGVWLLMLVCLFRLFGRLKRGIVYRDGRAMVLLAVCCGAHVLLGISFCSLAVPLYGMMLLASLILRQIWIDRFKEKIY